MVVRRPVSTTQPATQTVDLTADSSPLIIRPKKPRKQKQKSRHQRTKLSKLQLTKPESEAPLPEGISRSTFPTVEDGKQMSSTVMMTRQLKAYHAKFGKKIKIYTGDGRRSTWRYTDYIDKEKQCKRFKVPFNPAMACKVCVKLGMNDRTKEKKILPGAIWEHTIGVCSTVEGACQSSIANNEIFKSLLRANMRTPIKKLIQQIPFRCNVNEVTRARQSFIRREVSGLLHTWNILYISNTYFK